VNGKKNSMGYDIANSDIIWQINGLPGDIIPCPVFDGEIAYLMSAEAIGPKRIQAVNLTTANGVLDSSSAFIWTQEKKASYVPSALLSDGKLYYLKGTSSEITCVEAKTGKIWYDTQKPEGMKSAYASPVAANGNIYMIDREGTCAVLKEGAEFNVIAQNKLSDRFDASPAIVGKDLILRGFKSVYCISEP
jgi:outer membrane protein assembly factor BamB